MLQRLKVTLLLVVMCTSVAVAQKTMDVSKFSKQENDLMARVTKPVRDKDEGKLCALIRVVTNLKGLEFRADALGIVQHEEHNGEYWLYVPYGARSLSFSCEGYYPLLYQYEQAIEEGMVYELRLNSYETSVGGSQNLTTQMFVLSHQPDEATVFIDDMEVPTEFGVFAAMMSKGDHTYKVVADQYEDVEGSFSLADQPIRETVKLNPLFGTFQLQTQPENGFSVSINGKVMGKSPFKSGRLEPGSYKIHVAKDKFYPKDTVIRLREGDALSMTTRLTSFTDSLFYNRILGGRNISFGVNVGYLFPFVKSSAGGSFVGSPVNYSLTDAREDVSYSSQSGFTVGVMADIRLYKNLYLTTGVNYAQVKYTNKFSEPIGSTIYFAAEDYAIICDLDNSYEENYTLRTLEIPILASYRFVLTKYSSVHLNLGPYFTYGLSAKMKLSGSTVANGEMYQRWGMSLGSTPVNYIHDQSNHISGDFDLYSKDFMFNRVEEGGIGLNVAEKYSRNAAPYKKFNYGLKAGVTYELRGFQLGLSYNLQLSNMGNDGFWESPRIPVINGQIGENNMSGYKHRIHSLEIKLGYIFRY